MEQIRFNPYEHDLIDFVKSHRKQPQEQNPCFGELLEIRKCCDTSLKEKIQYETLS